MIPTLLLILGLGSLSAATQDDAVEARLGEVELNRLPGTEAFIHPAPTLDRAVLSYRLRTKETYVLENGTAVADPVKFVGWKMPERKSVVLAPPEAGAKSRRLFLGGEEVKDRGEIHDAELLKEGTELALVERKPDGMVLRVGDREVGPFEEIADLTEYRDLLVYSFRHEGRHRLQVGDRRFDLGGRPLYLYVSPDGSRVAWSEVVSQNTLRPVVEGKAGPACDSLVAGIQFSPNGRYATHVTREGVRYRGWVNGEEIKSELSISAVRAFDDGSLAYAEMWSEPVKPAPKEPGAPTTSARGRLVVKGKREERVLPRPVSALESQGESFYGAARSDDRSVLVRIGPAGEVTYEEAKGRIDRVLLDPSGKRVLYSTKVKEGMFVQMGEQRLGPYAWADEFFHLQHTGQFGFVAAKADKVQLVVGGRAIPVALNEFAAPLRISKTELTIALAGIQRVRNKREVWVRVVPLE